MLNKLAGHFHRDHHIEQLWHFLKGVLFKVGTYFPIRVRRSDPEVVKLHRLIVLFTARGDVVCPNNSTLAPRPMRHFSSWVMKNKVMFGKCQECSLEQQPSLCSPAMDSISVQWSTHEPNCTESSSCCSKVHSTTLVTSGCTFEVIFWVPRLWRAAISID